MVRFPKYLSNISSLMAQLSAPLSSESEVQRHVVSHLLPGKGLVSDLEGFCALGYVWVYLLSNYCFVVHLKYR